MKKISCIENEQEISQKFLMKKEGFDIIFKFSFSYKWDLESITITKPSNNNPSSEQKIKVIPRLDNTDLFKMYLEDSYGKVIRRIVRYEFDPKLKSIINPDEQPVYRKVKDDIYECNDIIIEGDVPTDARLIVYDPQEKCLLKGGLAEYKKIPAPASIIFEQDLPDYLAKMADSAYNEFIADIEDEELNGGLKVELRDIDIDLSDLSSWFDKEKRVFKGYDDLKKEILKREDKQGAKVTPKNIAEATISRGVDQRSYGEVAKQLGSSKKQISRED